MTMMNAEHRRIPSVVVVDDPDLSEGNQSGSAVSGTSHNSGRSPTMTAAGQGRLLPYVPKVFHHCKISR